MKRKQHGKKTNFWKWGFLLLLAFQLSLFSLIWLRIHSGREPQYKQEPTRQDLVQIGTFTSNREQLNTAITSYLKKYQTKAFSYQVHASNRQIVFEGSYDILGSKIPLYIYFAPTKEANGAISLEVLDVSAGTLHLPTSDVLSYVAKHYKLPKSIQIDAQAEKILIDLPSLSKEKGLIIRANTLDLYNDQLIFDIFRENA